MILTLALHYVPSAFKTPAPLYSMHVPEEA